MRLFAGLFKYSIVLFALRAGIAAAAPSPATVTDAPRPAVGVVLSTGQFQVAHTAGTGTATVLNGDEVESATLTSRVMLKSGNEVALSPHSSGDFYQDHANLRDGEVHIKSSAPFYVTARNFIVTPSTPSTQAVLQANGSTLTVQIATGGATITSSKGETLAHMNAGTTLAFDSLAGIPGGGAGADTNVSNAPVRLLGIMTRENGHYLLRDRYSNSVFEIRTQDAVKISDKLINHLVMVEGTWIGNEKSSLAQVDHVVQPSRIAQSDASTALPCAVDGAGGLLKSIVLDGVLSKVRNHFLVTDPKKGTYEVVGDVEDKEVGTDLHEKGFILPQRPTILPAEKVVYLERRKIVALASPCVGAIVGATIITTGALIPKDGSAPTNQAIVKQISF